MTSSTEPSRLDPVRADLAALYPGSEVHVGRSRDGRGQGRTFRVLPSARRPRIIVPADVPAAARTSLQRTSANDSHGRRAARATVGALASGPLASAAFPTLLHVAPVDDDSVEARLSAVAGGPIRFSLAGGSPRANAKPVLGVYRPGRGEVGFCKVGLTELASRLVAHEADVLQRLAAVGGDRLVVPPVLHAGAWDDHELVLLGAVRGEIGPGRVLPVEAMRAIAGAAGLRRLPWTESPWVAAVVARSLRSPVGIGERLRELLAALVERNDGQARTRGHLLHGSWHGDWGPWNMAWSAGRAVVWDWERFSTDVPAGFDVVHFTAHARLRRIGDRAGALDVLARRAEPAVAAFLAGFPNPAGSETTAVSAVVDAYLLELACRFAVDAVEVRAPEVERLAGWYLDVASARIRPRRGAAGPFSDVSVRSTARAPGGEA